jgi:hypothetical protein
LKNWAQLVLFLWHNQNLPLICCHQLFSPAPTNHYPVTQTVATAAVEIAVVGCGGSGGCGGGPKNVIFSNGPKIISGCSNPLYQVKI